MSKIGELKRDNFIAGDYPTKTEEITITNECDFKCGDVIAINDSGNYTLVDSTQSDGSQNVVGIVCDDVKAEENEEVKTVMYVKGEFAVRGLNFGGDDTWETHQRRMTEIGLIVNKTKI